MSSPALDFYDQLLLDAAAATARSSTLRRETHGGMVIQVDTVGFSGTLDFQGNLDNSTNWGNLPYVQADSVTASPSAAQVSYTASTQTLLYTILAWMPYFSVNMTRSAGSVSVRVWVAEGFLAQRMAHITGIVPGTAATSLGKAEDAAHTSGDTGIQVLGVYHATATQDAGTDGDYAHPVFDANGALFATLATLLSGEDQTLNRLWGGEKNSFVNITTATTTVVKTGAGKLHAIIFNKPLATSVVTLYDNTAASGTVIGTITLPAALTQDSVAVIYDIAFATGLTVVTATASSDITVAYL